MTEPTLQEQLKQAVAEYHKADADWDKAEIDRLRALAAREKISAEIRRLNTLIFREQNDAMGEQA